MSRRRGRRPSPQSEAASRAECPTGGPYGGCTVRKGLEGRRGWSVAIARVRERRRGTGSDVPSVCGGFGSHLFRCQGVGSGFLSERILFVPGVFKGPFRVALYLEEGRVRAGVCGMGSGLVTKTTWVFGCRAYSVETHSCQSGRDRVRVWGRVHGYCGCRQGGLWDGVLVWGKGHEGPCGW